MNIDAGPFLALGGRCRKPISQLPSGTTRVFPSVANGSGEAESLELTGSVPPTLAFIKHVDYLVADESRARWLLLQFHPSPADPFRFEIHGYLDAVSNLDERNAAVHPELFAIEGHCSIDRINACPLAGKRQRQPLLLGYSPYREVAVKCNRVGTGLFDFTAFERSRPAADATREVVERWLLYGL